MRLVVFSSRKRFALGTLLLVLVGCAPAGDIRRDRDAYLKHAADWAPTEAETARTVQRILATQFVDEAEVRRQIAADLPRVTDHIARIEGVRPATKPLQDIHNDYVAAWRSLRDGYDNILRGLDTLDVESLGRGRRALEVWRAAIVGTADRLRGLGAAGDQSR